MNNSLSIRAITRALATLIGFCLLTSLSQAQSLPVPEAPQLPVRGYILQDYSSGIALAESKADERMEPASITKLMSAYVIYVAMREGILRNDDMVSISEKAWKTEGSRMFAEVGKQISVHDLLLGLVVQSGNDSTVALAEHIGGTEEAFAVLMNQHSARLGLTSSNWANSTGLPDPNHYTTPRDIAKLVSAVIRDFPEHYEMYSIKEFTYNKITQQNRNKLLWRDASVDGVKTGHTQAAGYCLASSAKRGEMRLISVVLGAESENNRLSASQSLLNYGFSFYETHRLYGAGEPLTVGKVWKGETDELPLGLASDLYVTIPRGRYPQLNASLKLNESIEAPAAQGQPFGQVEVTLEGKLLTQVPLVALSNVSEGSFFSRSMDSVMMTIGSWFD